MSFEKFLNDYERRGLLKEQVTGIKAVEDLISARIPRLYLRRG